ncbi:MAG: uroporphyrinogen-III C-methyltransferase [Synergistaceae bacterium]|nr:uroporphyrinogen-III C-methyltransferase [Synergistaceae bacterium]
MVYLIGAGPGDAGLLTVKAKEILETAEVVIYDKLANEKILNYAPPDSEKIYVGKAAGQHTLKQSEINKLLVEKGAEKKIVVRLKGGDPFVFGRGGEEAIFLRENNIDFEIIPGVTAANSAAAVLGAPLMHDFAIISLSDLLTPKELIEKRLNAAAEADFVVCLYNPASHGRPEHFKWACDILLKHKSPETPAGWVSNIGRKDQDYKIMSLKEIRDEKLDMFCTAIIGNSQTKIKDNKMITPRGYLK